LNVNMGVLTDVFKPGGPCLTPVGPEQELLLSKGNVGILLGPDGRASRKASLTWSDTPLGLAFSRPYAVALLPNYVEIRSVNRLSSNGLAQVEFLLSLGTCRFVITLLQKSCVEWLSVR